MKKQIAVFSLVAFFLISLPGICTAESFFKGFNLKFSGGAGYASGGDFNVSLSDINSKADDAVSMFGFTKTNGLEEAHWGPDFRGEFVVDLPYHFSLGISTGYTSISKASSVQLSDAFISNSLEIDPTVTVIPLELSIYYNIPVKEKLNITVRGGAGAYFASEKIRIYEETYLGEILFYWSQSDATGKDTGIGLHGGLGIEYNITNNVALFFEGSGRYVDLKGWDVDNDWKDSLGQRTIRKGTWYYYDEYDILLGKYYSEIAISNQAPSGRNIKNARKANLSFSGFSFRAGIKIGLGRR